MNESSGQFNKNLNAYLQAIVAEFENIPATRRLELQTIADYVRQQILNSGNAKLTFICTHNSRRSHLCQVWAQIAAAYWNVTTVETFSGGTEATAFNPRAVAALQRCGLVITQLDHGATNSHYHVTFADNIPPIHCFSKIFDAPPNPNRGYCAVMTCTEADQACPVVIGCDLRAPLRFEDPKVADDTPRESEVYDERSRQVCREMMYLMFHAQSEPHSEPNSTKL